MYRWINTFIARQIPWRWIPFWILVAVMAIWSVTTLEADLLHLVGLELSRCETVAISGAQIILESTGYVGDRDTFVGHIPYFFKEELDYRVPLFFMAFFPPLIIPSILIFSGLFGLIHCDITNVFVQGSAGIILSIMFLKCGGVGRNILGGLKGLSASTATHTIFMLGNWIIASHMFP